MRIETISIYCGQYETHKVYSTWVTTLQRALIVEVLADGRLLERHMPAAWLGSREIAGAAGLLLAANLIGCGQPTEARPGFTEVSGLASIMTLTTAENVGIEDNSTLSESACSTLKKPFESWLNLWFTSFTPILLPLSSKISSWTVTLAEEPLVTLPGDNMMLFSVIKGSPSRCATL